MEGTAWWWEIVAVHNSDWTGFVHYPAESYHTVEPVEIENSGGTRLRASLAEATAESWDTAELLGVDNSAGEDTAESWDTAELLGFDNLVSLDSSFVQQTAGYERKIVDVAESSSAGMGLDSSFVQQEVGYPKVIEDVAESSSAGMGLDSSFVQQAPGYVRVILGNFVAGMGFDSFVEQTESHWDMVEPKLVPNSGWTWSKASFVQGTES